MTLNRQIIIKLLVLLAYYVIQLWNKFVLFVYLLKYVWYITYRNL